MPNLIIMPCRNCLALSRRALKTLLAQDIGDVAVWILNNDSTDGTNQWAGAQRWPVMATHYKPMASVAHKWNDALRQAFEVWNLPYALVVNNDVELRPDAYRMLAFSGEKFVTCVGVNAKDWIEKRDAKISGAKSPHPDFSCFLIRRSVWKDVGPFDENFIGAYCEDWDFHVRMHKAGIDAVALDVPYLHHAASTIKHASRNEARAMSEQAEHNREYFYTKWGFRGATPEYEAFFGK